jgi:hypothetical protein
MSLLQETTVRQSYIIEIDGIFVGAAAFYGDGYTFKGVDARLKDMDGQHFARLSEVKEAASRTWRRAPHAARVQAMSFPPGSRA